MGGLQAIDPPRDALAEPFAKILNDKKFDFGTPAAGESVERVNVADLFQRLAQNDRRLFFDFDGAPPQRPATVVDAGGDFFQIVAVSLRIRGAGAVRLG